jgi:hypothetical protein
MSQPPPFVLPPNGPGARVRALLAGAGRQRVAVAVVALAALVAAGAVWARATPRLTGAAAGGERPRRPTRPCPEPPPTSRRGRLAPPTGWRSTWPVTSAARAWSACPPAAGSTTPSEPRAAPPPAPTSTPSTSPAS